MVACTVVPDFKLHHNVLILLLQSTFLAEPEMFEHGFKRKAGQPIQRHFGEHIAYKEYRRLHEELVANVIGIDAWDKRIQLLKDVQKGFLVLRIFLLQ